MSKISDVLVNSVNLDETDVVLDECLPESKKNCRLDDNGSIWQYGTMSKIDNIGNEVVDHPSHYAGKNGIEAIDVIDAYDLNFNMGSALKYILRCGKKDDEIIELEKAIWYLKHEVELRKQEKERMQN